jgi:hypothetical protein
MTKKISWPSLVFLLLVAAYGLYAARFIERTSFIIDGEKFYTLFDDAMISMRYAKNLAEGHGPVWNPGERVEGFTNPAWVGLMAIFHLLPLEASKMSLPVQISSAVFLAFNLFFVKKIADELTGGQKPLVSLGAVFLTAFYFPLNNWSLQGMEVGLVTLLLTASAWQVLRSMRAERFSAWPYILLGFATWVRMDAVVPYLTILGFLVLFDPQHRRQHLIWGGGLFVAFIAVQTALRVAYYGDPLPNTYYLKMQGYSLVSRVKRGLTVYAQFIWTMNWLLFAIPFVIVLIRLDRSTSLLLLLFLAQSAYSVYVGGDAWEHKGGANRFISSAMPGFFVIFVYTLDKIRAAVLALRGEQNRWIVLGTQLLLIPVLLASIGSFNTLLERDSFEKWSLIKRPIFVAGNEKHTIMGELLRDLTTEDASIAVVSAGAIPYYSDLYTIDLLGKADKVIAEMEPRSIRGISDDEDFRPGHNKWDYSYSIGELKPDIVVQLWSHPDEARPYLDADYLQIKVDQFPMYFLKDSPHIRWDQIP